MSDPPRIGVYDKDRKLLREIPVSQISPDAWRLDEPLNLQPGEFGMWLVPGEHGYTLQSFPPTAIPRADA